MLTLIVPGIEMWDDENNVFKYTDSTTLVLEHSLVSLARWESKWKRSFLNGAKKNLEETWGYVQAMVVGDEVPIEVIMRLEDESIDKLNAYIEDSMTATTIASLPGRGPSREIVTAELIYHWMISLKIPLEWETRHLARLFTLIQVVGEKNSPKKKMSAAEAGARQRELNAQRKAQMQTPG